MHFWIFALRIRHVINKGEVEMVVGDQATTILDSGQQFESDWKIK